MRLVRSLWISLICIAVVTACGADGPALDDEKFEAATAAAKAMGERFAAADPAGEPPRATDPEVAADLAVLYDNDYLAGLETLPIDEAARLGDWSKSATEVGLAYLMWGTGKTDVNELVSDAKALERVNANTVAYREEIGPYLDFALRATEAITRASAAHLESLSDEEREKENIKSGAEHVRSGFAQTISGGIAMLLTPGLPDEWLIERLPAISASRETASTFLSSDAWRALVDQARATARQTENKEISNALMEFAK